MKRILLFLTLSTTFIVSAQNNTSYWQQEVDYKMEVDMNVKNFQYTGTQELVYTNNSPDTLRKVFYHLFILHVALHHHCRSGGQQRTHG